MTIVIEKKNKEVVVVEKKITVNQNAGVDQIPADWEQGDETKPDFIKNKPTIPGAPAWGGIGGDIGDQSDLITLFNTKENKNRTILDSDNFDEVTANGKYSASYGAIVLDVANAYGKVFQRVVYQANNTEKFRWQTGGEWNDWVKLADESDIANLYTALSDSIGDAMSTIDNKVDKVIDKGLSTNDYTTTEKNKLAGIEAGAQANVIPTWNSVTDKPETFPPAAHNHNGMVTSSTVAEIVTLTQSAYDALSPKVATTLYIITGA